LAANCGGGEKDWRLLLAAIGGKKITLDIESHLLRRRYDWTPKKYRKKHRTPGGMTGCLGLGRQQQK